MAKEMSANSFYESGKYLYGESQKLEDSKANPVQIKSSYHLASFNIWMAFSLGHLQAPYSLSVFFNQGVGVKHNDYVAKLLFGVALELEDEKCQWETNKQEVPDFMNKAVQDLTRLIRETNSKIPSDMVVEMELVNSQMVLFDASIALPGSDTMLDILRKDTTGEGATYDQPQGTDLSAQQDQDVPVSGTASQPTTDDSGCCCVIL